MDASVNPAGSHPWLFADCGCRQAIFGIYASDTGITPEESVVLTKEFAAAYRNSPACTTA
jgi:hypothetical protein